MRISRRSALGLAAGAALAACRRDLKTKPAAGAGGPIDARMLAAGFPALTQRARPGAFAMGLMNLATTETWYWNTDRAFPLMGAVAAPIAATVMAQLDAGRLTLNEPLPFGALDLSPPPSLIGRYFPTPPGDHRTAPAVSSLLPLALHEADTTAIDVLLKRVGGPGGVGGFLEQKGATGLSVDRYQREIGVEMFAMPTFRPEWKDPPAFDAARDLIAPPVRQQAMDRLILDPRDAATVPAALGFLAMLAGGQLVTPGSTARLLGWMADGPPGRFAPGLPDGANIARVGGAAPEDLGFVAAASELAVVSLPHGRRFALAGFLVGSTATEAARRALFADGARLAAASLG